eukprot:CAMPEP_0198113704 /NCGR_PEP_ID=MMETSP1442-20131203/5314_1 /TAXON_ID= /ORGANISM="Craspedostauros australis, Strain CCMP3328" /LENGTH=186 /DNA_ID=CAMNT_0043770875 /DNA_START=60 /DNA_END=620 /DNA_ORIENTATION=-
MLRFSRENATSYAIFQYKSSGVILHQQVGQTSFQPFIKHGIREPLRRFLGTLAHVALLVWAHCQRFAHCFRVLIHRRCQESCFVWLDDIRFGSSGIVRDDQETGCHQFHDADAEVLLSHGVDADAGAVDALLELGVGWIDAELDMISEVVISDDGFELGDASAVVVVAAAANENELEIGNDGSGLR